MYVYFTKVYSTKDKQDWECYCKATDIFMGTILIYNKNNQYFYSPHDDIDFSIMHLEEILEFLDHLNNQ